MGLCRLSSRRLSRAAGVVDATVLDESLRTARREIHEALRQALFDFGRHQFNTVVSGGMKMLNALARIEASDAAVANTVRREGLSLLLRLLSPIVPHITHTLWRELDYGEDVLSAAWPKPEGAAFARSLVTLGGASQRQAARPDRSAGRCRARRYRTGRAKMTPTCSASSKGKPVRKIVIVPGKLVNLVC
jgi:leucyl-tRNA synthetase